MTDISQAITKAVQAGNAHIQHLHNDGGGES